MKIHLITFGDGDAKYIDAAFRLSGQAIKSNWFETVESYDFKSVSKIDDAWMRTHNEFIKRNNRGCGYWIWKPKIILEKLLRMQDGEILLYLDSGCELSISGEERFHEYIELTQANDMLLFYLNGENYKIGYWTKKRLLDHMGISMNDHILTYSQNESGIIFLKNSWRSRNFLKTWLDFSTKNQYELITDTIKGSYEEYPFFVEHRHDQAILTLLGYTQNFGTYIRNENYFPDLWANNYHPSLMPIAAFRNLSSTPRINSMKLL